ncbi:MAG TPA: 2-enoyl thioester reductase domain-containing protein [Chthoniobacteraceae bacterium]|nr:2-enoyl thioester reductase domain-containing protein [Chthoniobacteraceae bacterium]
MLRRTMQKVRAIVFHARGDPLSVAKVEAIELPEPAPGEAEVRMLYAPINPADLNVIEGKYPIRPKLPAVPGVEGVGVIEKIDGEDETLRVGTHVLLPHGIGTWRERAVVPAKQLTAVPSGLPPQLAAMLKINPATALRMLRDFVALRPGDWILQNAANSAVGRAVMQIARRLGLRTANVVRRAELVHELKDEGDVVVLDDEKMGDAIRSMTGLAEIRCALNAVGGESALRLAKALAPGGTIVTYGAMSLQPLRIPNSLLIFKDQRWRGFWITQWYERASREAAAEMFRELFAFALTGMLRLPVERTFTLDESAHALARAQQSGRRGKILWDLDGSNQTGERAAGP